MATKFCNHPGLVVINGCPKEKRICCMSCDEADCAARCAKTECEHVLELKEEKTNEYL